MSIAKLKLMVESKKVELDVADDRSDPNQTVAQVTRLADGGVVAIAGPAFPTAGLAIRTIVNQDRIPDVALGAADQQVLPVTPYMWQTGPLSSQVATACLTFLKGQGMTRIALLTDTRNAYAIAGRDATEQRLAQYGVAVVADETFEATQIDLGPQIAGIQEARPDLLLVWATGPPPAAITRRWAAAGTGIPLMMTAAEASPLYLQAAGPAAEGVYVEAALGVVGRSVPAANPYRRLIDGFALPYQRASGAWPPQFAWDAMIAMSLLFDAVRRRGATREGVRAGLDGISLDTPQGHYAFTAQRHFGMPDSSSLMSRVTGGRFVPAGITRDELAKAGR